jgi:hypothetical protein
MTTRDVVRIGGLFALMLACLSVAWASSNNTVGTPVPDCIAQQLEGGACNNKFETDNANPVYCGRNYVGCNGNQMPNSSTTGEGNSGSEDGNCGTGSRCQQTYTKAADCAL